ncbi:hypothetical protein QOZ80_9AG0691330 [Eleusine coracana subsp. coracana]|nr:hypothetical protein QOZ80_9AG0691330 [Eleusine coracana subsp. coracana]
MDAGDDSNAGSRRPRITRGRRYRPSRPDPNSPAALALEEWRSDGSPPLRIPVPAYFGDQSPLEYASAITLWSEWQSARAQELAGSHRSSATRSQASSSSAAPPSDHPEAERTRRGTRVRQSVLYSNRPRRSRPRRPSQHLEHPSEVSSRELELEVANVSTFEAPSVRETSIVSPSETEEYPSEASISELGRAVTDLPTLEALSLRDSPLLTTQMTGEETDDEDDESSHIYMPRDVQHSLYSSNPIGLRIPMTSFFETVEELQRPDSDEESSHIYVPRDVGQSLYPSSSNDLRRSTTHGDSRFITVSLEELRRTDSDEDSEETLQQIQHLMDAESPCTIRELFDSLLAPEHAALTALAAEHGTEPPRDPFLVDEESQLAPHASAAAAQPLASMTTSPKASAEENMKDGKKWMRDEVKLCFKKHIEKTTYRTGLDFELDELCHQCFNVESYTKVFHHYNFKMRTKMPSSLEWTVELYFAEVKEIFGRKFYFCCPLEPNENGHCYACKNQGVEDLKHPATGGFEVGLPDAPKSSFWWCSDEDE